MNEQKGFFAALFDFSFSEFITSRLIRILYALKLIVAALIALMIMVVGFRSGFFAGIGGIILAVLFFFIIAIVARVWLEILIVIFRIAEDVHKLAESKEEK